MLLGANNVGTDVIRRVGRYRQVVYYNTERTCAGCIRESEHLRRVIVRKKEPECVYKTLHLLTNSLHHRFSHYGNNHATQYFPVVWL